MIFLLLMSFFLVILSEHYIAEKKFLKETETIRLQEYYMLCSVKDVEMLLREEIAPTNGINYYKHGNVSYQTQTLSTSLDEVTFNLRLYSGEKVVGIGQYDKEMDAMIKWREKN